MDKNQRPSIFKRLLALLIDFTILGVIGYLSGLGLEDFYVSLGKYGTLVGSAITIVYFSILQSPIGKGQTIGKRAIGAKVTDLQGEYLSLGKSFLRSFIVFFPIMNVEVFSGGNGMIVVITLLALTIFASFYFIIVNKSRRCLHDILVKSVVTYENVAPIEVDEQNDRSIKKLIPIGILAAVMIGGGIYQTFTENTLSGLLTAKAKIEKLEGVISVNEVKSTVATRTSTNAPSTTYSSVEITVRIDDKEEADNSDSEYFNECYDIIQEKVPSSHTADRIAITLYYGYNIGIASKTKSITKTFTQ